MSNKVNANANETQTFIGKSKFDGAEEFSLSQLTLVIVDTFNNDDASTEDLMLAGKLANEAGTLRRKAIWAASCNESPSKSGMKKGEYFLKFLGLEDTQSSKEISRARIQSLVSSSATEWDDLNDSCLDQLNSNYRNHGEHFTLSVYGECKRRVALGEESRITRPLIREVVKSLVCSTTPSDNRSSHSDGLATIESTTHLVLAKAVSAESNELDTRKEVHCSKSSAKARLKIPAIKITNLSKLSLLPEKTTYQDLLFDSQQNEETLNRELEELTDDLDDAEQQLSNLDIKYSDLLMVCNWFTHLLSNVESDLRELSIRTPQLNEVIEELVTIKGEFLDDIDNPVMEC
jgi:hypothetical protein